MQNRGIVLFSRSVVKFHPQVSEESDFLTIILPGGRESLLSYLEVGLWAAE